MGSSSDIVASRAQALFKGRLGCPQYGCPIGRCSTENATHKQNPHLSAVAAIVSFERLEAATT